MKKIVLLAFVLLSLCVASLPELQMAHASPYTSIDVDTAYNMITNGSYPDLVALDVRTKNEYDSGHIYGAVWIPVTELAVRIGELAGHENHEIIVYCASGGRSVTASGILDSNNFTKVYNMLLGISAWQSAGYPVWIATVHNVNTTFNYDTIQSAIDAARAEDTILVDAGTYYEHVVVNKPISLIGENKSTTVIDGNGTGNVIDIPTYNAHVTGFTIRNGTNGIFQNMSDYNIISGNIVTDNQNGIQLYSDCLGCNPARDNIIRNNIIKNNGVGMYLEGAVVNRIYHNNFINNTLQVYTYDSLNIWTDGYPSGGNYWSDYTDVDLNSGPGQNEAGSDGIGDFPHMLDGDNKDSWPLMGMFSDFSVAHEEETYDVHYSSNSEISAIEFDPVDNVIRFNVAGPNGTDGFCRICIPHDLMKPPYNVTIDDGQTDVLSYNEYSYDNVTCIYFTYQHSTHKVEIIPEFPTSMSMLLMLITLTVAISIYKRRPLKTPIH